MPADRPSRRNKQLARQKQRRADLAVRRELMFEALVRGVSYAVIAYKNKISVRTVRREVDRALDQRHLETPGRYIRLQVQRLTTAIQTIDHALGQGDYRAAETLLKVIEKLDRYHGLARTVAADPVEAQLRLEGGAAPLALVDARQGHQRPVNALKTNARDLS